MTREIAKEALRTLRTGLWLVPVLVGCSAEPASGMMGVTGLAAGSGGATPSGAAAPSGSGGRVAEAGAGRSSATAGSRSMGGRVGAAAGAGAPAAGGSTAPAATGGDMFASGIKVAVHQSVSTILVVTWMQMQATESTWLEFSFAGGAPLKSRPVAGSAGAHRDVVLGVPAQTAVTIRIVNQQAGQEIRSPDFTGMTGALPARMPKPTLLGYDAARASPDRWMLGAVEDSDGGCNNQSCYYHTTFWLYIMDRQARIVWYYADPASNATSSFQRIARDGEYLWIEKRPFSGRGTRSVLKTTLDGVYSEEVPVANLSDCIDVTADGTLLYDTTPAYELRELSRNGQSRMIWSCPATFGQRFQCYSNTVNWNPISDTVLMSFPEQNTVVEIDRKTGMLVGQYGDAAGSYAFSPPTWKFQYQHFANITKDGTLLVSSHMPGYGKNAMPVANQHAFMEFTIDRPNKTLIEKWIYREGNEWAMYKGMAIRLPNGNTLANYGTGGAIREITPDKQTVFHIKWDAPMGNDFYNKMVGHNVLIDDLYALNGGPKR